MLFLTFWGGGKTFWSSLHGGPYPKPKKMYADDVKDNHFSYGDAKIAYRKFQKLKYMMVTRQEF